MKAVCCRLLSDRVITVLFWGIGLGAPVVVGVLAVKILG